MPQETRQQHEEKVAKYIAEHRPVSGGKDNPPDRYVVVTLSQNNDAVDSKTLSDLAEPQNGGFRVIAFSNDRVLMGNYKENK